MFSQQLANPSLHTPSLASATDEVGLCLSVGRSLCLSVYRPLSPPLPPPARSPLFTPQPQVRPRRWPKRWTSMRATHPIPANGTNLHGGLTPMAGGFSSTRCNPPLIASTCIYANPYFAVYNYPYLLARNPPALGCKAASPRPVYDVRVFLALAVHRRSRGPEDEGRCAPWHCRRRRARLGRAEGETVRKRNAPEGGGGGRPHSAVAATTCRAGESGHGGRRSGAHSPLQARTSAARNRAAAQQRQSRPRAAMGLRAACVPAGCVVAAAAAGRCSGCLLRFAA